MKTKRKCNTRCNKECPKWYKCLKELGLPEDFSIEDRDTRYKTQYKPINTAVDRNQKIVYHNDIILHTISLA